MPERNLSPPRPSYENFNNMNDHRLQIDDIEESPEIRAWLGQFPVTQQQSARSLLVKLRFVSRDAYSAWVLESLTEIGQGSRIAVFAVRKFSMTARHLWTKSGKVAPRPATSQGSEDFTTSLISIAKRRETDRILDHPSIELMRQRKPTHIVLLDDSIGSGTRICRYIQLMKSNKTFLSWWSGGFINLTILSWARTLSGEDRVLQSVPGSNHRLRVHPAKSKVAFRSYVVYDHSAITHRWGSHSQDVLALCDSISQIPYSRRRGFGSVMSNIVFFHSVPNNIPGMLTLRRKNWTPLFPDRVLPDWLISKLIKKPGRFRKILQKTRTLDSHSDQILELLLVIRSGLRTKQSISRRLELDLGVIDSLVSEALAEGLMHKSFRLTSAGGDFIQRKKINRVPRGPDHSLYIPTTWRIGQ